MLDGQKRNRKKHRSNNRIHADEFLTTKHDASAPRWLGLPYLDPGGLAHHPGDGAEVVERPLRRHARRARRVREDAEVGRVLRCKGTKSG